MKNKRFLALCVALLLLLSFAAPVHATDVETNVIRVAGSNRYDTAMQVNQHFTESKYAVFASGEGFADALSGGQLAGILNAPIYLTPAKALPSGVLNELTRLGVEEVYIIGGTSSVSTAVEETLKEAYTVHRLAGANRYETAQEVIKVMYDNGPRRMPNFFADGRNFPDALSANPYVNINDGVLHLVPGNETVHKIDYLDPVLTIFGGENSVKAEADIPRLAGANRYATSMEIFKQFENPDTVILVDGTNYPDALSAAGYAADLDAPIVLVVKSGLTAEQKTLLKDVNLVVISGGTSSVSAQVEQDAKEILGLVDPVVEEPETEEPVTEEPITEEPVTEEPITEAPAPIPVVPSPIYDPKNPRDGLYDSPYTDRLIKGNINSKGEKIYHMPGMRDYNRTSIDESKGERWFATEAEARAAGWRKAMR